MTSPSIIGDDEAKRIASVGHGFDPASVRFLRFGEIAPELVRNHARAPQPRSDEARALDAYVAHHGERGPQPDWNAEHGVGGGC